MAVLAKCLGKCIDVPAQHEGEQFVEAVVSHEEEDEALYFDVIWTNGSKTEEPLENLVDTDDWSVNQALVDYASSVGLNLEPFFKVLKEIFNYDDGQQKMMSDSE